MNKDVQKQFIMFVAYLSQHRVESLSDATLDDLFQQANMFLLQFSQQDLNEYNTAHHYVKQLLMELLRRKLKPKSLLLAFDSDANLVIGKTELEAIFAAYDFDKRLELLDSLTERCRNDEQRRTLINIAIEVNRNE